MNAPQLKSLYNYGNVNCFKINKNKTNQMGTFFLSSKNVFLNKKWEYSHLEKSLYNFTKKVIFEWSFFLYKYIKKKIN